MRISPNVVIMTAQELDDAKNAAFQRGVERGKYEQRSEDNGKRIARNCAHWKNGRCEYCGAQTQDMEVHGDFACPHFEMKTRF